MQMHFTSGINRPPFEHGSGFLQVTSGCSHASCSFCSYFKDSRYIVSPMDEIEHDVKLITRTFGPVKRIFLQGADAFAADYDTLMKTAELIHRYAPHVESIGGYARIDNFADKTEEQVRNMRAIGFDNPYVGIESGDDRILTAVHKGYDAALAREQLEKLTAAGFPIIVNFLNGLGGHGYGLDHARKTAALYDGIDISMIEISSLTIIPGTILDRQMGRGEFEEATEIERLEELQEFVRCLTNDTVFLSDHGSVPFRARVHLPEQKQELIDGIGTVIAYGEDKLRQFREYNPGF